jgi:hypothetical protein
MKRSAASRRIRTSRILLILVQLLLGFSSVVQAKDSWTCDQWLNLIAHNPIRAKEGASKPGDVSQIIAAALSDDPWEVASLTEADKLEAIKCLLTAENDQRRAAFGGVTRLDVSEIFAMPPVSLAALFAISYIYSGHYKHADGVALRGEDASYTDSNGFYATKQSAIHRAYISYRKWFDKVRQLGLTNAQAAGLQPLEGSGLRWY